MHTRLPAGSFYGKTLSTRRVSGFRLTEVSYTRGLRLPQHSHELAKFCFVLAGGFRESLASQTHTRMRRALTFLPPDTPHAETHEAAGRHFLVEIEAGQMDHARQCLATVDGPLELGGCLPLHLILRLHHEFRSADPVSSLVLEGLAIELLAEAARVSIGRKAPTPPRWLKQILEVLDERFTEHLTLADLAASAGVHPIYLARIFRRFQGCTLGDHVRRLRIDFTMRELGNAQRSLAEIALTAGFADQSHFSRTFKRYTGLLPSQYRALVRG